MFFIYLVLWVFTLLLCLQHIYHLILPNLLCLRSPFCRLQDYSSLASVYFSLVGEVGSGTCLGFLLGGTGAFTLEGGDEFSF